MKLYTFGKYDGEGQEVSKEQEDVFDKQQSIF